MDAAPTAQTRVGPFILMERLDVDRGAALFRGVRPDSSREPRVVAIRVAEDPRDEKVTLRIRHEYAVLRSIDDPRVPKAIGFYGGPGAIALTWTEGPTLADILTLQRDGKLALDNATALDILCEVAQALRAAHAVPGPRGAPLLHSWIGAARVQLSPRGAVTLHGFGVVPPGTHAGYTPPEQAAGAFVDPRSDQWALGALGVELLLGERLYTGSPDRKSDALNGRVQPWLDRVERRCPSAARVFAQMLAPAAGERYAREADLIRDLLEAARLEGRPDRLALASHAWARLRPVPEEAEENDAPTQVAVPVSEAPTVRIVEVTQAAQSRPRPLVPSTPLPPDPGELVDPSPTGFFPRPVLPLEGYGRDNPTLVPEDTDSNVGVLATLEDEPPAPEPEPIPEDLEVTRPEDLPVVLAAPPAPEPRLPPPTPPRALPPAPLPRPELTEPVPLPADEVPPIPHFMPAEYVGIAMGALLIVVGIAFMVWRFV